jgi:molybdopterin-guanine dinucleotide biosynthesis protein A
MTEASLTAIVLAGGRSSRFGRDKLREPVDGRPLVDHALAAVGRLASETLLVVGQDTSTRGPSPASAAEVRAVRIIHDPEPFGGPAVALLAALEAAAEPIAIVVAGDMPSLAEPVLRLIVATLRAAEPGDVDAVALVHRSRVQPMPIALRVGAATEAVRRSVGHGDRSVVGVLRGLRVRELAESEWRPLDPSAATLVDVDRPEDLVKLR